MALSEREQRLLEEMERNLYDNEADVLTTLGATRRAPNYTAIAIGVVVAVLGLVLMIVGVSVSLTWLGILGFVVLFAGVMVALTIPGPEISSAGPTGGSSGKSRSVMDQLNDRWERRQRGDSV